MFVGAISVQWWQAKKVISGTIVNCRPPALLLTNNLSSALSYFYHHFFQGNYSEEFHVKLTFKRWNENFVRIQLLFGSFLGAATFWGKKLTLGTRGNVSANMQSLYSLPWTKFTMERMERRKAYRQDKDKDKDNHYHVQSLYSLEQSSQCWEEPKA